MKKVSRRLLERFFLSRALRGFVAGEQIGEGSRHVSVANGQGQNE